MIDWVAIERAGFQAGVGGVERGLHRIEARAKELAPVRKVFGQNQRPYSTRLKSIAEIDADRGVRRQLGLGPESTYINPPSIVVRRAPQNLTRRTLGPLSDPYTGRRVSPTLRSSAAQNRLDRRGRYELKSLRSAHEGQLGGQLRSGIHSTKVVIEGKRISGKVVSPAPYSKYQELGTRHNPAHPYMRPAGHESREPIRQDIGRSVVVAVKPLFRGRIDVVVKTRAR